MKTMSLRKRLLISVSIVLMLGGAASAILTMHRIQAEMHDMLDPQLVQITQLAASASGGLAQPIDPATKVNAHELWETALIVQRWDGDKMTSLLSHDAELPRPTKQGFSELTIGRRTWVTYAVRTSSGWLLTAQPGEARKELMESALLTVTLPSLVVLPIVGAVIALLIHYTLRPMHLLTDSMARRAPLSTKPIDHANLPDECLPMISAFNGVLRRVSEAVNRERVFITDAAHALRTPITAIQLQAESLREAKSRADFNERINDLIGGIARGRHTVEQLLNLSKAQQHHAGSTLLDEALRSIPERHLTGLRARALTMRIEAPIASDIRVKVDPNTFGILLDNLIDNAIRYSRPETEIVVNASQYTASQTSEALVRLSVRNFGPSLPAEEMERVFERFYRPVNDTTSGTGLGLSIVRSICESADGRSWLEQPTEHEGLLACVELPIIGNGKIQTT